MRIPPVLHTIRFRLSAAFAVVVFVLGSALLGGLYLWELTTLVEPVLMTEPVTEVDPVTGEEIETDLEVVFPAEEQRVMMEKLELDAYRRALASLRRSTLLALTALFFGSFVAGWWLSGRLLAPVRRITGVAQGITATDLGRRIDLGGPRDELRDLGDTFDSMLDRLEVAFDDQRRFVAETSHELRNPLAVARTNLELALHGGSDDELRQAAATAHDATERMSELVGHLLDQARAALPVAAREPVDLSAIASAVTTHHRAVAAARDLHIELDAVPAPVQGDPQALRRALTNLVANALRLAPAHSTVMVAAGRDRHDAWMSVTDQGPGLDRDQLARVFDQFWQGPGQEGQGAGLGLAIVRRIAERHGGSARAEPVGSGTCFVITLPAA